MKTFIRFLLLFGLLIYVPIFTYFLVTSHSGQGTDTLKEQLNNANVYSVLYTQILSSVEKKLAEKDTDRNLAAVLPFIKKEISVDYLQNKIEGIIDDTDAWASGKSSQEPVLSFTDLQDKITKENPAIKEALDSIKEMQSSMKDDASTQDDQTNSSNTPDDSFNFLSLLQKNLTYPLGKYLFWVKFIYIGNYIGLLIISTLICINVLLIFLLSLNNPLPWLGLSFILASFSMIVPLGIAKSFDFVAAQIHQFGSNLIVTTIISMVTALTQPLFVVYFRDGLYIAGACAISGIILILLSRIRKSS